MCFEFLAENTRQIHMLITLWVFYCLFVSGWQMQALFSRFRKFGCDPNKKKKFTQPRFKAASTRIIYADKITFGSFTSFYPTNPCKQPGHP